MACTRVGLLLLLSVPVGCAAAPPAFTRIGMLPPGSRFVVHTLRGDINAYAPRRDQPPSEYTIEGYGPANATIIRRTGRTISVDATAGGVSYLIRGSQGSILTLYTQQGSINVADVDAVVNARDDRGDVTMLIPQYGNASVGEGNLEVTFASTTWPGTLHFTVARGDVTLYVNEHAAARVHLHTDRGTIYTDFPLHGGANGSSETINGAINGGAACAVEVEVGAGAIRLLQLKPQV
ncbi:MAG TPA: hypothetical protein VGR69_09015 [Candidatus Rubrimentiphilum sp.]|nr:hypothetical protein [Candidatus Rubrimentiphilum sp.]